jgi:hypothetical protein
MRRSVPLSLLFAACVTSAPAAVHAESCSTVSIWGTQVPDRTIHPCTSTQTYYCDGTATGVDPEANVLVEICTPI